MGGVIGGKWGEAKVLMENVVSAPVMDVYNDVVSAYQWYAFRGCGMLIGHTEEPYSDGRTSGNATASFLTCKNVNVFYGDWVDYTYYQFAEQTDAEGNILWYSNYPWVRAEEGKYCEAFSNIRYGVPLINGVKVTELSEEEFNDAVTDYTKITFDQLYGADRGMYGTNKHPGVNVSYSSPKTFYIENNVGWENLTLHYTYEIGEETWTTIPDGVELVEFNGVYRIDLPVGAKSFTITADGDYTSKEFIVSELTEKDTLLLGTVTCTHETTTTITENVVNATCTANGSYESVTKCAECDAEISRETVTVEKLGHTAGTTVVEHENAPTCTENGSYDEVIYCTVCTAEISRKTITTGTLGHTYVAGVCSCGDDIRKTITIEFSQHNIANETDANGLKFEDFTINASKGTHQNSTPKYYTSDASIRVYVGNTLTVKSEGFVILNITFTTVSDSYNLKNAKFTSGTPTTTETTTILTGIYSDSLTLTNANSGKTQMRIVKMEITYYVGESCKHDVGTKEVTVEPTCTEVGYTATVCSNCDMVIDKTNEVSARGHDYDEGNITTEASCTTTGGKTYTCQVCGDEKVETVDPLSHTTDNGICENCGANIGGGTVDPTPDPEEPKETTTKYTFTNYPAGTQYAKNEVHVLDDIVTIITNDAHFTSELRLYSSSTNNAYAIIKSKNPIRSIGVNAGNKVDTLLIYGSNDEGATWTQVATISVTSTSYKDYSAELNGEYMWLKLDVEGSNQVRLKSMTLTTVDSGSEGGDNGGNEGGETCEHTNTVAIGDAKNATCTEDGITVGEKCVDCGYVITEQETIEATGHNYVDGACTGCGEKDPDYSEDGGSTALVNATLDFSNKANRTTYTTSQQIWEQNGVKLINDKSSSTSNVGDYANPARFYKSSKITIEAAGMSKIVFTCSSNDYATALKSSIASNSNYTVTVSGSTVTVTFATSVDSFVITSLTGGQVRMNYLVVNPN